MIREVLIENVYDIQKLRDKKIDRIELNSALFLGGLTPSIGKIKLALSLTEIPLVVMVRPRAGGFIYSKDELEEMKTDIREIGKLNIEGFVFGVLDEDLRLSDHNKELIDMSHDLGKKAVLSRAFDNCLDLDATLEKVEIFGFDRVLTSGLKPSALDGIDNLRYIRENLSESISIVAASGIDGENMHEIMEKTGIDQFHASLKGEKIEKSNFVNVDFSYLDEKNKIYELNEEKLERFLGGVK